MQPTSLDALFACCRRSAVHLESQDSYGVEHESAALQQWITGAGRRQAAEDQAADEPDRRDTPVVGQ